MSDLISREATIAAIEGLNHGASMVRAKQSVTDRAVAAVRALPAAPAVKVKPLVWEESVKGRWIGTPPVKLGDLSFWIFLRGSEFGRATKNGWEFYPTLEAAKAAAQADYEARILAALEGSAA